MNAPSDGIAGQTATGGALLARIMALPFDARDAWCDGLLGLGPPPDDDPALPRGAVPYVPCGVDAIARAAAEAPVRPDDVFVDLGAGVGRACLLVHLLSGARCLGVELQAPLVEEGHRTAARLGLPTGAVDLLHGDAAGPAADAAFAEGTVFFSYASFAPSVLARVLDRLEAVAARRRIVLCAVGFDVHGRGWLRPRASSTPELVFYDAAP